MSYKKATFCKEYTIDVKLCELGKLLQNDTIADWLIYHPKLNSISQDQLAIKVGFFNRSCIKDIEKGRKLPSRNSSTKLATYFKLQTKYFYDNFFEDTYDISAKVKKYRNENNLNIKEATKLIGIAANTLCQWENKKAYPSRLFYPKLKELNIL